MVQNVAIRMSNMEAIVVGNIVAVVQERVRKVATWANHGGGDGEMHVQWLVGH